MKPTTKSALQCSTTSTFIHQQMNHFRRSKRPWSSSLLTTPFSYPMPYPASCQQASTGIFYELFTSVYIVAITALSSEAFVLVQRSFVYFSRQITEAQLVRGTLLLALLSTDHTASYLWLLRSKTDIKCIHNLDALCSFLVTLFCGYCTSSI